jgi:hypothetical protein
MSGAFDDFLRQCALDCVGPAAPEPEKLDYLRAECFRCSHSRGEHDESECRGGEDIPCHCIGFDEPEESAVCSHGFPPNYPDCCMSAPKAPEPEDESDGECDPDCDFLRELDRIKQRDAQRQLHRDTANVLRKLGWYERAAVHDTLAEGRW